METVTLGFVRWPWTIRALGRNPLVRFGDRVEAILLIMAFVTALLAVPVAGAIGTAVYSARAQVYSDEATSRHTVAATAIGDSTLIVARYSQTFRVPVGWRVKGAERVGSLDLPYETKAGDQLDVWVDGSGNQVAAPTPSSRAVIGAVCAGAGAWLVVMTGVAGLSAFVRSLLIRRRHRGWDREWAVLVSDDGGRTGSQT
jgi:hypothetical protein